MEPGWRQSRHLSSFACPCHSERSEESLSGERFFVSLRMTGVAKDDRWPAPALITGTLVILSG